MRLISFRDPGAVSAARLGMVSADRALPTASLGPSQAALVAAAADITVINQTPGADPYTGARLDRPSVSARIHVPYRLTLLGFVGSVGAGRLTLAAHAEIRP